MQLYINITLFFETKILVLKCILKKIPSKKCLYFYNVLRNKFKTENGQSITLF